MGALMAEFNKAYLDHIMSSYAQRATLEPTLMVVSPYVHSVFTVTLQAADERWDWRRTKRELRRIGLKRKGARRPYHKRALDG